MQQLTRLGAYFLFPLILLLIGITSAQARQKTGMTVIANRTAPTEQQRAMTDKPIAPDEATSAYPFADDGLSIRPDWQSVPITTTEPVLIVSLPIVRVEVGQTYQYRVRATGLPIPTFSLIAQPDGMTINPNSGLIQWTPMAPGDFTVIVQASNGVSPPAEQRFTLQVTELLRAAVITSTPITTAIVGQLYQYDVEATGIPTPGFYLSVHPAGMVINRAGLIEWLPTATGDFPVTVLAENGVEPTSQQSFTLNLTALPKHGALIFLPLVVQ